MDTAYLGYLNQMLEIGADLLRMVQYEANALVAAAQSGAPPYPMPNDDLTLDYERVTRSMRRSILLAKKLAEPAEAPAADNRTAARKRIIREVEDAIHREVGDDGAEALHAELHERLDSADLDDEIANRTIPEIVTDMCRDFGIAGLHGGHPWRRRTPHDIAVLCARAAGLAIPASPQVDQVEQQRAGQTQSRPAEPRATNGTAQRPQQPDTG